MSRHFRRACDRATGFSLVELLVVIIIAAIAFAALVPVFVNASKATSADKARNLAKSVAQDRIEKVRQLPYNLITENNLKSAANRAATASHPEWKWAAQFGPTATATNEAGSAKTYDVSYGVTFVGGDNNGLARTETTTGNGTEDYLKVTVAVTWQGNPRPPKTVQLQTLIFRQNDGPQVTGLDVLSLSGINEKGWLTHSTLADPITFRAVIGPADSGFVKLVKFRVDGPGGPFILADGVLDASASPAVAYKATWVWTPPVVDGTYTVSATAYSSATGYKVYAGNTWTRMLTVEQGPPAAPTAAYARAGDHEILLGWTPSASQDVASYDVYRSASTDPASAVRIGSFSGQSGPQMSPVFIDWGSEGQGPPGGDIPISTSYHYWIVARDRLGNPADPTSGLPGTSASGRIPATTAAVADTGPPAIPSPVTLTSLATNQSIAVNWSAEAVDPESLLTVGGDSLNPNPTGGLGGYFVFRDDDLTEPYAMILLKATTWTNLDLGWYESHTYTLRAFDGWLNVSGAYGPTTATTPLAPTYNLRLTTVGPCAVTVTNRSSQVVVTNATDMTGGSALGLAVAPGDYDIKAVSGSVTKSQTVSIVSSDLLNVATGF